MNEPQDQIETWCLSLAEAQVKSLVRVIAHEWLRDVADTTDNQNRIVKFLHETLTTFEKCRSKQIDNLFEEVQRMARLMLPDPLYLSKIKKKEDKPK